MRKALLVFALVAFLATGTVFAELTGVGEPTVSGSVTTQYGYDLDTEAHGFYNDSSLTVTLPLISGDMTKGGDDGMYGEITVEDLAVDLRDDGLYDVSEDDTFDATGLSASISAKLVLNSLFVELGAPDFEINKVDVDDDYAIDANFWDGDEPTFQGAAVGFMNDMVTVVAKIANYNDGFYDAAQDNDTEEIGVHNTGFQNDMDGGSDDSYTQNNNGYVLGAELTLNPAEGITIPVVFSTDLTAADTFMAIGAAPSISMGMLTVDIPFDYVNVSPASGFEVMPSIKYYLTEAEGSSVAVDFLYGSYTDVGTIAYATNTTAYSVTPVNALADLSVVFTETETKGFVDNLAATLEVTLADFMDMEDTGSDALPLDVDADASYNMNGLKPYVNTGYNFQTAILDLGVGVELGAAFTGLDNTVITLDYTNDALVDGEGYTKPVADTSGNTENGRVTLDVTVSF